jgi:hypothetical protein
MHVWHYRSPKGSKAWTLCGLERPTDRVTVTFSATSLKYYGCFTCAAHPLAAQASKPTQQLQNVDLPQAPSSVLVTNAITRLHRAETALCEALRAKSSSMVQVQRCSERYCAALSSFEWAMRAVRAKIRVEYQRWRTYQQLDKD